MNIYLSGPLFTQAERRWNRDLARELEARIAGARVILPQDFKVGSSYNNPRDYAHIFRACLEALSQADAVVAVLDGPDVDSGTALELGVAYERGVPIIGVRTDFRESQDRGVNLVVAGACATLLREMSFGEDLTQLARDLAGKIVAALKRT
jgi:nucleoside 2-deoxyribosyltransferase